MRYLALTACLVAARAWLGWREAGFLHDLNTGDPGQWMDAGDRILAGSWPYRDWTGIYGPLLYAWGAAWYRLLGADWRAAALMLDVVSPVASLLLAALAVRWAVPPGGWRTLGLIGVFVLGLDACYWAPALRIWIPLAALALAASSLPLNAPVPAAAACIACGISPFVSPETGIAAAASCAVMVVASPRAGRLPALAWLTLPAVLGFALCPGTTIPFARTAIAVSSTAGWVWGVPFPGSAYPWRAAAFVAPFIAAALLLVLAMRGRIRHGNDPHRACDLGLAVFAALSLRIVLGRTDVPHLLFAVPPLLIVFLRWMARGRPHPAPLPVAVATAAVVPFLLLGLAEGESGRTVRSLRRTPPDALVVAGERMPAPPEFAARTARLLAAARPLAPAGRPVLSLPGSLWAHLLRRPNALAVAVPELLGAVDASRVLARLDASPPSLVVIDEDQCLPWDPAFVRADLDGPLPGRLTWSTPADEALTRELRTWLARHYVLLEKVDGARLLVPARSPRALPGERVVAILVPGPDGLAAIPRGDLAVLPVPRSACDEVRLTVVARYPPGLAGLAKSYIRLRAHGADGRVHGGVLPVPPASPPREIRFPVPRTPLVSLDIEVGSPGLFNPSPVGIAVPQVRLVMYTVAR